jgi:hypothetical protein
MIIHTVLLNPKPEVSQEEIATALRHVRDLQQAIPGILDVQAGANLNGSNSKGFTHGFVMQFVDAAHLKAYAPHPAHKLVSDELVRISQNIIDFDLEAGQDQGIKTRQ